VLDVEDRLVALSTAEYQGFRRMTLTYPALRATRELLWIVTGEGKREALAKLLEGDATIPAGRVEAPASLVVADEAAAGGIAG
jgi:6-phosphogluconolactonase